MPPTPRPLEAILTDVVYAGPALPASLRAEVLAAAPAIVPQLLAAFADKTLDRPGAPGEGHARAHAATLLIDLRAPEALDPLLRALLAAHPFSTLCDALVARLPDYGPALLEPGLRAIALEPDSTRRSVALFVLAESGVRDERLFAALLAQLAEDLESAVAPIARYGDPRAIEPLERAARAFVVRDGLSRRGGGQTLLDASAAIERLGGTASPELAARVNAITANRARHHADLAPTPSRAPSAAAPKPGRNDPCPCGSGAKYKKCHLGKPL